RRIMLGTYALSAGYYDAYYLTALRARRKIKDDFDQLFSRGVHAVLMPTTVGPAFRFGEKSADPLAMYLEDIYTVTANLAGVPAISIPMGFSADAGKPLPLGLQIIAPHHAEERLLRIARMFEQSRQPSPSPIP
ncbi:MAG: Asp-tRNA(Asn)/Glu-tRNA(Gln) amidotransferase subunit GatA, partial [Phycisphaerae bacterium]|nr:Asp-tRNA(Asn)/Glu-tRNA(Gln) amidotransferase subunit GatA [Phycisphaerae bacterium]